MSILLIILLSIVLIDSYLIIDMKYLTNQSMTNSPFDFVIFKENSTYKAKNQNNGHVEYESNDLAIVFDQIVDKSNIIHFEEGEYMLSSDILISNQKHLKLTSDSSKIIGNGKKIIVIGNEFI